MDGRKVGTVLVIVGVLASVLGVGLVLGRGSLAGPDEPGIVALRGWIAAFGSVATFAAFGVAFITAYTNLFSPFDPLFQSRPIVWRLGQGNPNACPFNVVAYLTIYNAGAVSGAISDLLMEIDFPKGRWRMEPRFEVKGDEFFQSVQLPRVQNEFDVALMKGPFTPVLLPGRGQVTKAISFCQGLGPDDFNIDNIESGSFPIRLLARYDRERTLHTIFEGPIIFPPDVLAAWKAGTTQAGEVRITDRPLRDFPRVGR